MTEPDSNVRGSDVIDENAITEEQPALAQVSPDRASPMAERTEAEQDAVDEELLLEREDNVEIRSLKLTGSEQEILNDIEPALSSRTDIRITLDTDDILLKKAVEAIKSNFNEAKVVSELRKMYDLYHESQVQNLLLAGTIQKYLDKIDRYEARHVRDPRVMAALNMSQRHRNYLKEADEEKKDLQNELLQLKVDMKHVEDNLKMKQKEFSKLQEEYKKLKDIEKHSEAVETKLISKENELQTLKEKFEDDMFRFQNEKDNEIADLLAKYADDQSSKATAHEKDSIKNDQHRLERIMILRELEEVKRTLRMVEDDRKTKKAALKHCRDTLTKLMIDSRILKKNAGICRTTLIREENRCTVLEQKLKNLNLDYKRVQSCLEASSNANYDLGCKLQAINVENKHLSSDLRDTKDKLENTSKQLSYCNSTAVQLKKKLAKSEAEKVHLESTLKIKADHNDSLISRITELAHKKYKQAQQLRLSENNAMLLVKELSSLNDEMHRQKQKVKDILDQKNQLWIKLGIVKNHYIDSEEKSRLLIREVEAQKGYANKMEMKRLETEAKLEGLMRTNIELYNETNTQAEIQQLQVFQFKQKNKEIKGLQAMSKDKDDQIQKMECTTKELVHQIEQLASESNKLKALMEDKKSKILVMTEEIRIMISQLRKALATIKEYRCYIDMLRRKRDLFGARLIESNIHVGLFKRKIDRIEKVMKTSASDYLNMNNDSYMLKLEIKNLRRKLKNHEMCEFTITTLRQELSKTAKLLELEKARNVALVATKEPIVHRWRALLAADPSKYELHVKINRLTQRLINKTTEVVEKEQMIHKKDLCFFELRALLERRLDPNLTAEMSLAKAIIRKQRKQMQALTAEINMNIYDLEQKDIECNKKQQELDKSKAKVVVQQRKYLNLQKKPLPPIAVKSMSCTGSKLRVFKPTLPLLQMFN
uniref:Uncharacterized protein n=1 Tax=Biomphalaria glabrata TaxID=6526 RepID=A0A2C9LNG3_BIOGL